MTRTTKETAAGRPATERPVRNAVGLIRHLLLLQGEDSVNLAVATEIERVGGKPLMPRSGILDDAKLRGAIARRVLNLVSGTATVPHWVDRAAREGCVQWIMKQATGQRVDLTVGGISIGVARDHLARIMAEGLVGLVLEHATEKQPRKLAAVLKSIERLGRT